MAMDRHTSADVSSSKAVLLGALSSGVNGPTWFVLKVIFLMLGICLVAMLVLAFSSSDVVIAGHVILLVIISGVLFILLNSFLAQTGLVSVEQQMEEMGILHKTNDLIHAVAKKLQAGLRGLHCGNPQKEPSIRIATQSPLAAAFFGFFFLLFMKQKHEQHGHWNKNFISPLTQPPGPLHNMNL